MVSEHSPSLLSLYLVGFTTYRSSLDRLTARTPRPPDGGCVVLRVIDDRTLRVVLRRRERCQGCEGHGEK